MGLGIALGEHVRLGLEASHSALGPMLFDMTPMSDGRGLVRIPVYLADLGPAHSITRCTEQLPLHKATRC